MAAGYDLDARPGTPEVALAGFKEYAVGEVTAGLSEHPLARCGAAGQIAVAFDATVRVAGLRCRDTGAGCVVEVLADTDSDGALEDETGVAVETLNGSATLESAQLARTPSGGWVAACVKRTFAGTATVATDRNGDGDFADAGERALLGASMSTTGDLVLNGLDRAIAVAGANRSVGDAVLP